MFGNRGVYFDQTDRYDTRTIHFGGIFGNVGGGPLFISAPRGPGDEHSSSVAGNGRSCEHQVEQSCNALDQVLSPYAALDKETLFADGHAASRPNSTNQFTVNLNIENMLDAFGVILNVFNQADTQP